jgi:hypothetical protein
MMMNDGTPSVEEVLNDCRINEYLSFFKECAEDRKKLDDMVGKVDSKNTLGIFLAKVNKLKSKYKRLKKMEDELHKRGV